MDKIYIIVEKLSSVILLCHLCCSGWADQPGAVVKPRAIFLQSDGQTTQTLTCTAVEAASYQWVRVLSGQEPEDIVDETRSQLTFEGQVVEEDTGVYFCRVTNQCGRILESNRAIVSKWSFYSDCQPNLPPSLPPRTPQYHLGVRVSFCFWECAPMFEGERDYCSVAVQR